MRVILPRAWNGLEMGGGLPPLLGDAVWAAAGAASPDNINNGRITIARRVFISE